MIGNYKFGLIGLGAIVLLYLLTQHQGHLFSALPFLLILACLLMHVFMHGGHGGGHNGGESEK